MNLVCDRMRIPVVIGVALLLAGCGLSSHRTMTLTVTKTVTVTKSPAATPGQQNATYFGTVVALTKVDAKRYLLVLKPQAFLVGITANVAFAAEQGTQCQPLSCPGVPDDRLVVPAGTENLDFVLPASTNGTVLTLSGQQMRTTTISAAQLAAVVAGAKTPHLIEPLDSGLWLAVDVDKVTSFAQQFQP